MHFRNWSILFLVLLFRTGFASPESFYEYDRFGFSSDYRSSDLTYTLSNGSRGAGTRTDQSLRSFFVLHYDQWHEEVVELSYLRSSYQLPGGLDLVRSHFHLAFHKDNSYTLNPKWFLKQVGSGLFSYYGTSALSAEDCSNTLYPVYQYATRDDAPLSCSGDPRPRGYQLGVGISIALEYRPLSLLHITTGPGLMAAMMVEHFNSATVNFLPSLNLGYRFHYGLDLLADLPLIQPFFRYRVVIADREMTLLSPYRLSAGLSHQFELGIMFKFSLLLFG